MAQQRFTKKSVKTHIWFVSLFAEKSFTLTTVEHLLSLEQISKMTPQLKHQKELWVYYMDYFMFLWTLYTKLKDNILESYIGD